MASNAKKKTTMAKIMREQRLRERRLDKQAKKDARKLAPPASETSSRPATPACTRPADPLLRALSARAGRRSAARAAVADVAGVRRVEAPQRDPPPRVREDPAPGALRQAGVELGPGGLQHLRARATELAAERRRQPVAPGGALAARRQRAGCARAAHGAHRLAQPPPRHAEALGHRGHDETAEPAARRGAGVRAASWSRAWSHSAGSALAAAERLAQFPVAARVDSGSPARARDGRRVARRLRVVPAAGRPRRAAVPRGRAAARTRRASRRRGSGRRIGDPGRERPSWHARGGLPSGRWPAPSPRPTAGARAPRWSACTASWTRGGRGSSSSPRSSATRRAAPTLPGPRGRPAPRAGAGLAAVADGVEAAMDAAGMATAHLVGNSLGGQPRPRARRREGGRARWSRSRPPGAGPAGTRCAGGPDPSGAGSRRLPAGAPQAEASWPPPRAGAGRPWTSSPASSTSRARCSSTSCTAWQPRRRRT
jgi:hypothetical protein